MKFEAFKIEIMANKVSYYLNEKIILNTHKSLQLIHLLGDKAINEIFLYLKMLSFQ